tara:strand:- start:851 stop:1435 length:585 start_codon:yes stop_codon:yes gene_type:complete
MTVTRREKLLDTALGLFRRHGYHATGVGLLLAESGVARQTLYNHFGSKDDLVVACLKQAHEEFERNYFSYPGTAHLNGTGARARIASVFDELVRVTAEPGYSGCPFHVAAAEYVDPNHPIHRVVAEHEAWVESVFRDQCLQAGVRNAESVSRQLALLVRGALARQRATGDARAAVDAREMATLVMAESLERHPV